MGQTFHILRLHVLDINEATGERSERLSDGFPEEAYEALEKALEPYGENAMTPKWYGFALLDGYDRLMPWLTVLLPRDFRVLGQILEARRSKAEISVAQLAPLSDGERPSMVGVLIIQSRAVLVDTAARFGFLGVVANDISLVPDGERWFHVVGAELEPKLASFETPLA